MTLAKMLTYLKLASRIEKMPFGLDFTSPDVNVVYINSGKRVIKITYYNNADNDFQPELISLFVINSG